MVNELTFFACAWGIAGKDGKPMKEPPHPLARGKVPHVGDPVAIF
jgi:aerobic carbon-monoxide dehydrogenase large subunit